MKQNNPNNFKFCPHSILFCIGKQGHVMYYLLRPHEAEKASYLIDKPHIMHKSKYMVLNKIELKANI